MMARAGIPDDGVALSTCIKTLILEEHAYAAMSRLPCQSYKPCQSDIYSTCSVCKKVKKTATRVNLNSGDNANKCMECRTPCQFNVVVKLKTKSRKRVFDCSECKRFFTSTSEEPSVCTLCKNPFVQSPAVVIQPFRCLLCKKLFSLKEDFDIHMRVHGGEKLFECRVCNKVLSSKCHLEDHMAIHSRKPWKCMICQKLFGQEEVLHRHLLVMHSGKDTFECTVCKKYVKNLGAHMLSHSVELPFKCAECERSFRYKPALSAHLKIHTGEKPYECTVCKKSFRVKYGLTAHMRIHSGKRPYKCVLCEKSFSGQSNLASHLLTHSKPKPLACTKCNMSFRYRKELYKHEHSCSAKTNG